MFFKGNDGGSAITALTLDMSAQGNATFNNAVNFPDGGIAYFGTGQDLEIFHDGNHSVIKDVGQGSLFIGGSEVHFTNSAVTESMIKAVQDAQVELFYNAAKKFETTSTGVEVTGAISDADGTSPVTLTAQSAAKAYVSHTFSTTINNSLNIASTTDLGTGIAKANFTNNMENAYSIITGNGTGGAHNTTFIFLEEQSQTVAQWEWNVGTCADGGTNTLGDTPSMHNVNGDLA